MPNIRILSEDFLDGGSTITTTGLISPFLILSAFTELKSEVCRLATTGGSVEITIPTAPRIVSSVVIPICNFTANAIIRVEVFATDVATTPILDTGFVSACAGASPGSTISTTPYAYGYGSVAEVWFAPTVGQKVKITFSDSSNPAGYLEIARLLVGNYWEAERNVEWESPNVSYQDATKTERSEAGDIRVDRGTLAKKLSLDLSKMTESDRTYIWKLIRTNGAWKPMYVSVSPGNGVDSQIYSIYGRLSASTSIQYKYLNQYTTSLQLEEI